MLHQRTWVEIDLEALSKNLATVRAQAGPGVDVMLVLKADAYGHGAVPVAWHLLRQGVSCLGVGDSTEALELRSAGITAPILILGAVVAGEMEDVIRGGILVTVHSGDRVRQLRSAAERSQSKVGVHLKVDTGMGRLGCKPERALGIAREVRRSRRLELQGLATHLASTGDMTNGETEKQVKRFRRVLGDLEREGIHPRWRHAYASNALLAGLAPEFNLVRPGLSVYGVVPGGDTGERFTPALSWRTQVVFLKDHRRGARIGYGGTWTTRRPSRIATLPVGYNDGYRFAFSNKAEVLVRGRRCPVVGRVSMDYVCVDVTHVEGTRVGDVVTLLGRDGQERLGVGELATHAHTIPYEILCGIGRRVRRTYRGGAVSADGSSSEAPAPRSGPAGTAPGGTAPPPEAEPE
jgi:alanine racemase